MMADEEDEMSEVEIKFINKQVAANADSPSPDKEDKSTGQKLRHKNIKQQVQLIDKKGGKEGGKKPIRDFDEDLGEDEELHRGGGAKAMLNSFL